MSYNDNAHLFNLLKNGDKKARNKIIENNLGLVYNIVLKYDSKNIYPNDLIDLEELGIIGLIKAVDGFDIDKNIEFSTFATKCIYNQINELLRKKHLLTSSLEEKIHDNLTLESVVKSNIDLENSIINKSIIEDFMEFISYLSERDKDIVFQYFINNLSQDKIAEKWNISQKSVSKISSLTKKRFKQHLEPSNTKKL